MKKTITTLSILFLGTAVFAQNVDFSGTLSTQWGVKAPYTKNAGDFSIGNTSFDGSVEAYAGDGTAFAEGSVTYDILSNSLDFDLSEAYVDYSSSFWGLRIGAQKTVWGKADGVDITNSVFPTDSTTLFSDDSSLSINAARLSVSGSFFTVDAYWIPFFKGTKLPLEEGNPLRSAMIPSSVSVTSGKSTLEIPVSIGTLKNPDLKIENGEYGLKASAYLSLCDLSLYGFYGWDKTPLMNYQLQTTINPVYNVAVPTGITISGEYKRLTMLGLDAAFPIGETVLRLEGAFFPERYFQASAESILKGGEIAIKQNQIMGLAGIDWMPSGWTITAQYYCNVILNKSDKLDRSEFYTHGATLSISKTLLQETLELSLSGMIGLNDFDSVINADIKYSVTDQLKLSLGAYVFLPGPEKDGTYGKFKDLSTVFLKCEYSF